MSQLDEANEIIKEMHNNSYQGQSIKSVPLINDYHDKYLKPKDELFEKYRKLMKPVFQKCDFAIDYVGQYRMFKEIFKDELSGNKKAIEYVKIIKAQFIKDTGDSYPRMDNYLQDMIKRLEES